MEEMEFNFTEEERAKCLKVVDAFQEYFEDMGDTVVGDCGKFCMVWFRWYKDGDFGAYEIHDNADELFDALWTGWLEHQLITPVLGTPAVELTYEVLYAILPPEMKKIYAEKKEYFWNKAFGTEQ